MSGEKKQTLKLKIEPEVNYKLVGISSHENDYRLVWAVNNQLNLKFVRTDNLVVFDTKLKTDLEFSRFTYYDENLYLKYNLTSNRCPDGYLLPEMRTLDFILQITGEISAQDMEDLIGRLRKTDIISTAFVLSPEKIKKIEKLFAE
jgi:hypothetical protein